MNSQHARHHAPCAECVPRQAAHVQARHSTAVHFHTEILCAACATRGGQLCAYCRAMWDCLCATLMCQLCLCPMVIRIGQHAQSAAAELVGVGYGLADAVPTAAASAKLGRTQLSNVPTHSSCRSAFPVARCCKGASTTGTAAFDLHPASDDQVRFQRTPRIA